MCDPSSYLFKAKTPQQWEDSGQVIGKSPPCRGGTGL